MMRKLGYVLVIGGFACLAYLQLVQSFRGGARPILRAAYAKAEHGGRSVIPTMEVTELLRESVGICYDSQPLFLLPGAVMLIGAILIGRSAVVAKSNIQT